MREGGQYVCEFLKALSECAVIGWLLMSTSSYTTSPSSISLSRRCSPERLRPEQGVEGTCERVCVYSSKSSCVRCCLWVAYERCGVCTQVWVYWLISLTRKDPLLSFTSIKQMRVIRTLLISTSICMCTAPSTYSFLSLLLHLLLHITLLADPHIFPFLFLLCRCCMYASLSRTLSLFLSRSASVDYSLLPPIHSHPQQQPTPPTLPNRQAITQSEADRLTRMQEPTPTSSISPMRVVEWQEAAESIDGVDGSIVSALFITPDPNFTRATSLHSQNEHEVVSLRFFVLDYASVLSFMCEWQSRRVNTRKEAHSRMGSDLMLLFRLHTKHDDWWGLESGLCSSILICSSSSRQFLCV